MVFKIISSAEMMYRSVTHFVSCSKVEFSMGVVLKQRQKGDNDVFYSRGAQKGHIYAAVSLLCSVLMEIDLQ